MECGGVDWVKGKEREGFRPWVDIERAGTALDARSRQEKKLLSHMENVLSHGTDKNEEAV
jgi:hypothetical protein